MSGEVIGTAKIAILPETGQFRGDADAQIRRALSTLDPKVRVGADTAQFLADVEAAKAAVSAQVLHLSSILNGLKIDPNDLEARAKLLGLQNQALALAHQLKKMPVDADTLPVEAKLMALNAQVKRFADAMSSGGGGAALDNLGMAEAELQFKAADAAVGKLSADLKTMGGDSKATAGAVEELAARAASLRQGGFVTQNDLAKVQALAADTKRLSSAVAGASGSAQQAAQGFGIFGRAIAAISNTHVPLFATALHRADDSVKTLDNGVLSLVPGLMGLNNSFLFTASGVHMLIEGVIEFTAVWGPALTALTAFGIVAYPLFKDIYAQLTNMKTVANATGGSFKMLGQNGKTLSGGLSQLQQDIKPQVLQLWGDYLTLASDKSDHFGGVLKSVGNVLDTFGAKLVNALNSKTTSTFLNKAAGDIQGIGDGFVQLGRIIGTLLQVMPGYAEILLKVGDAGLTMAADLVEALKKPLGYFLAFHGAIFYLGLAATFLGTFGKAAVVAFSSITTGSKAATVALDEVAASEVAAANTGKLASLGTFFGTLAGNIVNASRATLAFTADLIGLNGVEAANIALDTAMAVAMDAIPFVAVAAAAVGMGLLIYTAFKHSSDGAVAFGNKVQAAISKASISTLNATIANGIAATTDQLNLATKAYTQAQTAYTQASSHAHGVKGIFQAAGATNAAQQVDAYRQQLVKLNSEQLNQANRMHQLTASYGGAANAINLMTLANVNLNDIATASASDWATDAQKIYATAAAYGFIGQQAGIVGNQLDMLNISTGTTATAMQNLASAESNWIGIITGGESAFVSFVQGNQTLATDLQATGASMNGLNANSLTARAAMVQQSQAAVTLYGSLQMLAAASGNTAASQRRLQQAAKDAIGTMLPFASSSKQAQQQLIGVAQALGYTGPLTYAAVRAWSGYTGSAKSAAKATKDLNGQEQTLTQTADNLSQAAKNLGNALQQGITSSQQQAILSSTNFFNIQSDLVTALQKTHGQMSKNAQLLIGQYYLALVKSGLSTQTAKQYTEALVGQVDKVPGALTQADAAIAAANTQLTNMASDAGSAWNALTNLTNRTWTVKVVYAVTGSAPGTGAGPWSPSYGGYGTPHKAAGGVVKGSGPSGKDSTLAMVAPGELIIPASHAAKYTAMAKQDGVPGLASGGMIGGGSTGSLGSTLQAVTSMLTDFSANTLSPLLDPAQAAVTGPQTQPVTQVQGMTLIQLMQQMVRLLQQQPQALGGVINTGNAQGVRRAFFATGG